MIRLISSRVLSGLFCSMLFTYTCFGDAHGTHWGYEGHDNALHWGELTPAYGKCEKGHNQSPVNIDTKKVKHTHHEAIKFNYVTDATEIINNGHTIQLNVENGSSIKVHGEEFFLKQFHFHTPSENRIDGQEFPLEVHFVHISKKNQLAVVAVMFEEGRDNCCIREIWNMMPHNINSKNLIHFSAKQIVSLLPKNKAYYEFIGSLTTPPCTENVLWIVLKEYSYISSPETREFLHTMHHENNRPIQNLFDRVIED